MLSPTRVGDPASARAFARPYRNVARRLERWEQQGHLRRDAEPAVYLHEYAAAGMTVRGLVGALNLSCEPTTRASGSCSRTKGFTRSKPPSWRTG